MKETQFELDINVELSGRVRVMEEEEEMESSD